MLAYIPYMDPMGNLLASVPEKNTIKPGRFTSDSVKVPKIGGFTHELGISMGKISFQPWKIVKLSVFRGDFSRSVQCGVPHFWAIGVIFWIYQGSWPWAWNRNELADVTAKFRWRMSTLEQSTMVYWEYSPNSHNLILIYGTGWWVFHNFPLLPRHKSDTYHILYIPCTTPIQQPSGWHSPGWDGRRSTSGPPFLARLSMPCGCAQGMAEKNEDMKVS